VLAQHDLERLRAGARAEQLQVAAADDRLERDDVLVQVVDQQDLGRRAAARQAGRVHGCTSPASAASRSAICASVSTSSAPATSIACLGIMSAWAVSGAWTQPMPPAWRTAFNPRAPSALVPVRMI